MELKFVDPRSLKDNPNKARRSKASLQADALLLATIKAVGVVQPPVVAAETDGGNGFVIDDGHRRKNHAIAAGLDLIPVLVADPSEDGGAMRSLATSLTHEQLNPVDLWRAIERLVALGWSEEAIGVALAQSVRQIKRLRLLANVLPGMLDHMVKGVAGAAQTGRALCVTRMSFSHQPAFIRGDDAGRSHGDTTAPSCRGCPSVARQAMEHHGGAGRTGRLPIRMPVS